MVAMVFFVVYALFMLLLHAVARFVRGPLACGTVSHKVPRDNGATKQKIKIIYVYIYINIYIYRNIYI